MWTGLRQVPEEGRYTFKTGKKESLLFYSTLYHEDVLNGVVIKILNAVS